MGFRLSIVQQPLVWENAAANRAHFTSVLAPLAGGTDLVILPEMFTTGFTMRPDRLAEAADGETRAWLLSQAQLLDAAVGGTVAVHEEGRYYNRFMLALPGGPTYWYDKRHLFRMANEQAHYAAGKHRLIVSWKGWRICPLICYDLRFPVWSRNRGDYDVLLYVANWPAKRRVAWSALLRARAIENLCYVVGVNRIGKDGNGAAYSGDSAAVDFQGQALGGDHGGGDFVETVVLDREALQKFREKFPAHLDADDFELRAGSGG